MVSGSTMLDVNGRICYVSGDHGFQDLLLDELGPDVADYYQHRIDELLDVIKDAYDAICSWRHDVDEARIILREGLEENGALEEDDP